MNRISVWPGDFGPLDLTLPANSDHARSLRANLEAILAIDGESVNAITHTRAGSTGRGRVKFAAAALAVVGVAALAATIGHQFRATPIPMQHWVPERLAATQRAPVLRGGSMVAAASDQGRAQPGNAPTKALRQEIPTYAHMRRSETADGQAPIAPAPSAGASRKPASEAIAEQAASGAAILPAMTYRRLPAARAFSEIASSPSATAAGALAGNDADGPAARISPPSTTTQKFAEGNVRTPDSGNEPATVDSRRREALDLIRLLRRQ